MSFGISGDDFVKCRKMTIGFCYSRARHYRAVVAVLGSDHHTCIGIAFQIWRGHHYYLFVIPQFDVANSSLHELRRLKRRSVAACTTDSDDSVCSVDG